MLFDRSHDEQDVASFESPGGRRKNKVSSFTLLCSFDLISSMNEIENPNPQSLNPEYYLCPHVFDL